MMGWRSSVTSIFETANFVVTDHLPRVMILLAGEAKPSAARWAEKVVSMAESPGSAMGGHKLRRRHIRVFGLIIAVAAAATVALLSFATLTVLELVLVAVIGLVIALFAGLSCLLLAINDDLPKRFRSYFDDGMKDATLASAVVFLLLASKHGTWGGGGGHDARYLILIVPFLCLLVAAVFARVESAYVDRSRLAPLAAFGALFFVSALAQIVKHALAWSRDIEPFVTDFAAGRGDAGAFLRWLFPHPFAGGAVLLLALGLSLSVARRQKIKRPAPPQAEPAAFAGAGEGT